VLIDGSSDCVVSVRQFNGTPVTVGQPVKVAVRPEDVQIVPRTVRDLPSRAIDAKVLTALFSGEHVEYQVDVVGQGTVVLKGDRHEIVADGRPVWLKLRSAGHSVWGRDSTVIPQQASAA
jgi:ABC-type Fe3+/spermidine/putrescine transport system ATPase subunit